MPYRMPHEKRSDKMRQNATTMEPPVRELTPQQDTVLAALLMGRSVTAAAGEAGIAR